MIELYLNPLFVSVMLLFSNTNIVHKFINCCLGELLSSINTAGSNISKNIKIMEKFSTGKINM